MHQYLCFWRAVLPIYGSKKGLQALREFLIKRGFWLIFLEFIVIRFGWMHELGSLFIFQVIWVIGASMLLLAAVINLGVKNVTFLAALIMVSHNFLSSFLLQITSGRLKEFVTLFLSSGKVQIGDYSFFLAYALLPWFSIMSLGYGFGHFFSSYSKKDRIQMCLRLGFTLISLFFVLRIFNLYGDPSSWSHQKKLFIYCDEFL